MSSISVYTFVDTDGNEQDWSTQDYLEAQAHAQKYGYLLIEQEWVYDDQQPINDYRPGHYSEHFAITNIVLGDDEPLGPGETCPECNWVEPEAHPEYDHEEPAEVVD